MQLLSLKWAWQVQLLKDKGKKKKENMFYICLACISEFPPDPLTRWIDVCDQNKRNLE